MKKSQSIVFGYFGRDNYGDEIMLEEFLKIHKENKLILVANKLKYKSTKTTTYLPHNNTVLRLYSMLKSKTFIWLGGTCLYSNKGLFSLFLNVLIAKLCFNKVVFLGIGIGEITKKIDYYLIQAVLFFSDSIYFRDTMSLETAKNIHFSSKYYIIPDLVNLHEVSIDKKVSKNLIINITKDYDCSYFENIREIVEKVNDRVEEIVLLPAELGQEGDIRVLKEIHMKYKSIFPKMRLSYPHNVRQINTELLQAKFYIGMRLHLLFVCDLMKIPSIGINYSPKIMHYNNEVGGSIKRIFKDDSKINSVEFRNVNNIDEKVKINRQLINTIINNI